MTCYFDQGSALVLVIFDSSAAFDCVGLLASVLLSSVGFAIFYIWSSVKNVEYEQLQMLHFIMSCKIFPVSYVTSKDDGCQIFSPRKVFTS